jgi:hypothetical protein
MKCRCPGRIGWRLLHVVEAVVARLPDADLSVGDRLPRGIFHAALHERRPAGRTRLRDAGADGDIGRAGDEERPEHRRFGGARMLAVAQEVDQHRHAERVGSEDEFLPLVVAHLADLGQQLDRGEPLLRREARLAHERVQVRDEARHHFLQARVGRALQPRDHRIGERLLIELAHRHFSLRLQ